MTEAGNPIKINRASVLTLWAAVVAERLGFDRAAGFRCVERGALSG